MTKIIAEGFVHRCTNGIAAQPRCATTVEGDVLCHYVVQSKLGQNDFIACQSRSQDGGLAWTEQKLWPHLHGRWSIIGAPSRTPEGDMLFFGARTAIDQPGEPFWCDATQGLKQNDIVWAKSTDHGHTWGDPVPIPNPLPGSAEVCGTICATRRGTWVSCYAPYHNWDPAVKVERNQVAALWSADQGASWNYAKMLSFPDADSTFAGAFITELSDGRLLGAGWHINETFPEPPPILYSLSTDGGRTWGPSISTGIQGQSLGLAVLPDGRAAIAYNQRQHGERGAWLAIARPTDADFGIETNEVVWRAATTTHSGTSGDHSAWTDYAFGGSGVITLPDNTLLVTLWCEQPEGTGIRFVKLAL